VLGPSALMVSMVLQSQWLTDKAEQPQGLICRKRQETILQGGLWGCGKEAAAEAGQRRYRRWVWCLALTALTWKHNCPNCHVPFSVSSCTTEVTAVSLVWCVTGKSPNQARP
jgi:hypothetical protein